MNIVAQFLLIYFIARMHISGKMLKEKLLNSLNILMFISLTVVASSIFFLVTDMFSSDSYNPFILAFISALELAVSMIMIGALISRLFLWLKRKYNLTVLLYLMAFTVFLLTTVSAFLTLIQELQGRTSPVSPEPNPWDISSIRKSIFYDVYRISSLTSFGLVWLATALLLKNYTTKNKKKLGRWKFWLLASLPLIYYILSFDVIINNLVTYILYYPFLRNLIIYLFAGTKQVGGFFFALSFFFMSRHVENTNLKNYLILSAVGIMMLFSSLQITVVYLIPYPPFGLITLTVMPISYYLVLIGLYYTARSLTYDKELLLKLAKRIRMESDSFLSDIGSAEWSQNLESTVNQVIKQNFDKLETEDVNSDISAENIRSYVLEVIKEIKDKQSS